MIVIHSILSLVVLHTRQISSPTMLERLTLINLCTEGDSKCDSRSLCIKPGCATNFHFFGVTFQPLTKIDQVFLVKVVSVRIKV